jgi:asparagine synthase (glutamine-hydrolysing)
MRRALIGVVPSEILNRKRKAYVVQAPIRTITGQWADLREMSQRLACSSFGIVDGQSFCEALVNVREGRGMQIARVLRTLTIENWLTGNEKLGLFTTRSLEHPPSASESGKSGRPDQLSLARRSASL